MVGSAGIKEKVITIVRRIISHRNPVASLAGLFEMTGDLFTDLFTDWLGIKTIQSSERWTMAEK